MPAPAGRDNVVLVGMPAAGKSTVGVLLAKRTARDFLDTDVAIQRREGRALRAILEGAGAAGFRALEERCVLELDCARTVIATGGSVVYSAPAMEHLARLGTVVFLDAPLAELEPRLGDLDTRGVVRVPGQTLAALHAERLPLYRLWAGLRVDCAGRSQEEVVSRVLEGLGEA